MNRIPWIALLVAVLIVLGATIFGWPERHESDPDMRQETSDIALRYRTGDFDIGVALDPTTPRSGNNRLLVRLTNHEREPLRGARVDGEAVMPMPGMDDMRESFELREVSPGLYQGEFELQMGGNWPLTLRIDSKDMDQARLQFDMATDQQGLVLAEGAERIDETNHEPDVATEPAAEELEPGEPLTRAITVDPRRRQLFGVTTGRAEMRSLTRTIPAVGQIRYDETALADITLRFDAWIGELHADFVGIEVRRGEPLFTVYGPELLAAQQEYLSTQREGTRRAYGGDGLSDAARKRLALWGLTESQLEELRQRGEPLDYLPIKSPRDGTVIGKSVVEGSSARAGEVLMRVADLSRVWVEAQLYEAELPLVGEAMDATITLPYLPGKRFDATVEHVYPFMDDKTRTARIRLSLDNPEGELRPDMYATVNLRVELGDRLVVPEGAVVVAGERRIVFRELGEGRLQPVRVTTGQRTGGYVEILEGLSEGERIVTSGTFLIASETLLRTGLEQW